MPGRRRRIPCARRAYRQARPSSQQTTAPVTVVFPLCYSPLRALLNCQSSVPLYSVALHAVSGGDAPSAGNYFLRVSDIVDAVDGFDERFDSLVVPDGRHLLLRDRETGEKAEWLLLPRQLFKDRGSAERSGDVGNDADDTEWEEVAAEDGEVGESGYSQQTPQPGEPPRLNAGLSEDYVVQQWKSFLRKTGIVLATCLMVLVAARCVRSGAGEF